jgi:hypothetical protein
LAFAMNRHEAATIGAAPGVRMRAVGRFTATSIFLP